MGHVPVMVFEECSDHGLMTNCSIILYFLWLRSVDPWPAYGVEVCTSLTQSCWDIDVLYT